MANNKESGTTSAPQVPNPLRGVGNIPNPSNYLFGTSSSSYHSDLNEYNHRVQSAQWDAQLALMADERKYAEEMYNKYNSPEAQVRQMREAGLNPDLQGVQSSGFSSPQSAGPSGGVPGMSTGGDKPLTLLFLQALPQAVQMASSIQGSIFNLQKQKLSIDKSMDHLAYMDILAGLQSKDFDSKGNYIGGFDPMSLDSVLLRSSFLKNNYSRRFNKSYNESIARYFNGNMSSFYKDFMTFKEGGSRLRRGYLDILSSTGFDLPEDAAIKVLKEFNDIVFQGRKKQASNDYLSSQNDAIPSLLAKANSKLDSSDRGDNFVGAIMYFLAIILQGNMSVNRSSDGKYSGSFGF